MIVHGISGVASTAAVGANPNPAQDPSANPGTGNSNTNGSANGAAGSADSQAGAAKTGGADGAGGAPGPGAATGSGSGGGSGSGSGSASSAIQQLDALIERLKAELAQVEQQIALVGRQRVPGGGPNPALNALQSEAHLIEGAILSAASELAELVMKQGQITGGVINTLA